MFGKLRDLIVRLDRSALRVRRPHHIVFLCGGVISKIEADKAVHSVRDYLHRVRQIEKRIDASVVLAETAQQLYRDTTYKDLISFEEDIARIASIVLVICESPGSLAELGSFSSEIAIRDALRILVSEEHNKAESFVRYGPIKRIENIERLNVGIFPWRTHKSNGYLVKDSVRPHFNEMVKFIKGHVSTIPDSFSYALIPEKAIFFDIVWLLSLLDAVPPEPLYQAVRIVHPHLSDSEIKNRLYALLVCGWIKVFSYSNREYYYLSQNHDPFEYAYLNGKRVRDISATKLEIIAEFRSGAGISKAVRKRLIDMRMGV